MKNSENKYANSHTHAKTCACENDPNLDHLSLIHRWLLSILFIGLLLVFLKPFIIGQMLQRVISYSSSFSNNDVVRVCKKIIAIDKNNIYAWTSLGYAYMDLSKINKAIPAFEKVLTLNTQDKLAASFELGQAYYAKGHFAKAIAYFQRTRSAGPRAGLMLDADILKYRHGTLGFRSLNSMQTLLGLLQECYQKTGDMAKAAEIQKEYDFYKNKHSKILF